MVSYMRIQVWIVHGLMAGDVELSVVGLTDKSKDAIPLTKFIKRKQQYIYKSVFTLFMLVSDSCCIHSDL